MSVRQFASCGRWQPKHDVIHDVWQAAQSIFSAVCAQLPSALVCSFA